MSTHNVAADDAATHSARSTLGTIALVLTAISVIGFILLLAGDLAGWKGFSDDESDVSTFADVVWSTFALGGILALLTGIAAWLRGRSANAGDVSAGRTAVGWFALALLISVIWSVVAD
jgi:hypothetical protein